MSQQKPETHLYLLTHQPGLIKIPSVLSMRFHSFGIVSFQYKSLSLPFPNVGYMKYPALLLCTFSFAKEQFVAPGSSTSISFHLSYSSYTNYSVSRSISLLHLEGYIILKI
jgi:hypothetical protein